MASNLAFLERSLKSVVEVDDFSKNLLGVQQAVEREGLAQPIQSCINRSDYMLNVSNKDGVRDIGIRQVEINAIASGMSSHCCNVRKMHNFLMSKYIPNFDQLRGVTFPQNRSLDFIASEMIQLHDLYNQKHSDKFILLIREPRSLNFSEHFQIEYAIHKLRPDIRLIRRRFDQLPGNIKLGPNKELLVDMKNEVALVYFRYGYDPSNYDFPEAWNVRLLIERSRAIKCPSIGFHVSGIKKFQQLLSTQEEMEKFIPAEKAAELTKVTCKFWSIEDGTEAGKLGFRHGMSDQNLVLKPQREGGGHNIYGKDVKPYLEKMANSANRQQYILMEMINTPPEKNWLIHPKDDMTKDGLKLNSYEPLVSELGIFGSIVTDASNIVSNRSAGYLVRSKRVGVNEGGVASGHSGISSIVLVDDDLEDLSKFYQL